VQSHHDRRSNGTDYPEKGNIPRELYTSLKWFLRRA
jgi:hypothetical protein